MARKKKTEQKGVESSIDAQAYKHPTAESLLRPEVGTQPQFKKKKPIKTYQFDSSLSPELTWDSNPIREIGEQYIANILSAQSLEDAQREAKKLKSISKPFLNWTGKAERLSIDVPTLPLFIHERLSTKAIIESIKDRKRQPTLFDLFHNRESRPATEQLLKAYEHKDKWVNRLILGDSLVVMNSLLEYEGMNGKVQMVFMDPPYGVKFGSNFQPFIRKKDVKPSDDVDMTREPEMVQAYRDTWEIGTHSYLTYMRDRIKLCHKLLSDTGSLFVQISDENIHHIREILDEIFGGENFISLIPFRKKTMPLGAKHLEGICDFLLWYSKDKEKVTYNRLYQPMDVQGDSHWNYYELQDGTRHKMSRDQINNHSLLPPGAVPIRLMSMYPVGVNETGLFPVNFRGKVYRPPAGNSWFTNEVGMQNLISANRVESYSEGNTLNYVLKLTDGAFSQLTSLWADTSAPSDKVYTVQTSRKVIERCILMATNPGDLVLDPTCGGGTTPVVAENWGRRWIAIDVSRVPLALTKQRLLSQTYPWLVLKNDTLGPAAGFKYEFRTNSRGEQIGGIVKSITRGSIANNETGNEIVLVDRPETDTSVTRVTGPFVFEATIPQPVDQNLVNNEDHSNLSALDSSNYSDRLLAVLRHSPSLKLPGNREVKLKDIRTPTSSLALSAEAISQDKASRKVAILFGPENGAISHKSVYAAIQEAHIKGYDQFIAIGFAIEANARTTIEQCAEAVGIPATYVQVTPDIMMGDLLKTMRSSQIFSVCGLPEIIIRKVKGRNEIANFQVELVGLDTFDPGTMETIHRKGGDVPAWFLDTDYNGLVFHVDQAFFPKTGAWENLKKALKGVYSESIWEHLAGNTSSPFELGEHKQIAVKVIDERGNELIVTKSLEEAKS